MALGVIRVVSLEEPADINAHGLLMEQFAGIRTVSMSIADQPDGVHDTISENTAVPKIISLAEHLSFNTEVDAITVSCAADPAVDQLRKKLDVAVFGAGDCGANIARATGSRIGVIGITEVVPKGIATVLGDSFFGYRHSDRAKQTTSLCSAGVLEDLTEHASNLKDLGADVLLFACTGFSEIGLKEHLRNYVSLPIIDLVEAQATSYALLRGAR